MADDFIIRCRYRDGKHDSRKPEPAASVRESAGGMVGDCVAEPAIAPGRYRARPSPIVTNSPALKDFRNTHPLR